MDDPYPPRRRFLKGALAATSAVPLLGCDGASENGPDQEYYVSSQGEREGRPTLVALGTPSERLQHVASGFRGHGLAHHRRWPGRAVLFERRPGWVGLEADLVEGREVRRLTVPAHRRLQGHGTYDLEGDYLFTTEADANTGTGVLGVWDAHDFRRLGEVPTGGIGPHEVIRLPGQNVAVVANGGIHSDLSTGEKLNLDTMSPSLVYLDLRSEAVVDEVRWPEAKASVRHLAASDDGLVVVALQVQRSALSDRDLRPLGAVHRPGAAPEMLEAPEALLLQLRDYTGSVAVSSLSRIAGFTSPRGSVALFWNIDRGTVVGQHEFIDVSGIAPSADGRYFVLSSSAGQLRWLDAHTLTEATALRQVTPGVLWDNHLLTARG